MPFGARRSLSWRAYVSGQSLRAPTRVRQAKAYRTRRGRLKAGLKTVRWLALYLEFLAEFEFAGVHFAVIDLVVVAAEVEQAVEH